MNDELDVADYIDLVNSQETFVSFVSLLKKDFLNQKDTWENITVDSYLEGILGFSHDIQGYCLNNKIQINELLNNPWRLCAEILLAGSVYE